MTCLKYLNYGIYFVELNCFFLSGGKNYSFKRWLTEAFDFSDGRNLTWNEPPPTQIVQAVADPVKHFSSRQLFKGTINATLNWHFGLRELIFKSLVIFFEGNSVARVSPSVTGTPPSYANRFGFDWFPNQHLMKLFIFNVTTEDNGTFSCRVAADSFDRYDTFLFESDVKVDVVGKLKAKILEYVFLLLVYRN